MFIDLDLPCRMTPRLAALISQRGMASRADLGILRSRSGFADDRVFG